MKLFRLQHQSDRRMSTEPPLPIKQENDFDCSVRRLYESFLLWYRLQHKNILTTSTHTTILADPTRLDRYNTKFQLLHSSRDVGSREIGRGKYATVYSKGAHAYKIIRIPSFREFVNITDLKCHLRELGFFHSLQHPNITQATRSQCVMEHGQFTRIIHEMHLAQSDLHEMIYQQKCSTVAQVITVFRHIARGLAYLHSQDIIHGDIKPKNILMFPNFTAQITDFTLTSFQDRVQETAFGSLFWRAPESLCQEPLRKPGDVWSFGMMLLDMVHGCCYMKDVMDVTDDTDMLSKLLYLVDTPTDEWKYTHTLFWDQMRTPNEETVIDSIQRFPRVIKMEEAEQHAFEDLISHILIWDHRQRLTMNEILTHPFFADDDPGADTSIRSPVSDIHWNHGSEREDLRKAVKNVYFDMHQVALPAHKDWFITDCVYLAKKCIDQLRTIPVTFSPPHIVFRVCQMMNFLTSDYYPDDPLFESVLFHLLHLLNFRIFRHKIVE